MSKVPTIAYLLEHLIDKYHSVEIQGLATFTIKQLDQHPGTGKALILPPTRRIVVSESGRSSYQLIEKAIQEGLLNKKQAKKLRSVIQSRVNELLNFGGTHLDGLGHLMRKESGQLYLESQVQDINKSSAFLPVLEIETLLPATAPSAEESTSPEKKVRPINTMYTEPSIGIWSGYIFPILSIVVFTFLFVFILRKACAEEVSIGIETKIDRLHQEPSNSESLSGDMTEDVQPKSTVNPKLMNYNRAAQPDSESIECLLIVGTFQDAVNASRMLRKIKSLGYKPFIQDIRNMMRVGIQFNCAQHDTDAVKEQIFEATGQRPWMLRPQYNPGIGLITTKIYL